MFPSIQVLLILGLIVLGSRYSYKEMNKSDLPDLYKDYL